MKINEVTASLINNKLQLIITTKPTALRSIKKFSEVEKLLILLTYKFLSFHDGYVFLFLVAITLAGFLYAGTQLHPDLSY